MRDRSAAVFANCVAPCTPQVLPAGPFHERCALTLLRQFHIEHAAELAGGWVTATACMSVLLVITARQLG